MLKNPLAKVSFVRNFGSGFEEAKASGASDAEALTAAGLSGMMNAIKAKLTIGHKARRNLGRWRGRKKR